MAVEKAKNVPPFVRFCTASVPMVFDDSMSYYECLCALTKFIQVDVINVINNNADLLETLDGQFKELKSYVDNYFANLDIQEEINNKLDEMAEGGQLAEIITAYMNSHAVIYFDTLADLKASDYLIAGSVARTKGCTSVDDNGAATYYIREIEEGDVTDNYKVIAYTDSLVAVKVIEQYSTPEQYGAVSDGSVNDAPALMLCISDGSMYKNFKKNATYKITSSLNISAYSNITINGNHSTIFCNEGTQCFYCYAWNSSISNIEINNLTIDGDRSNASYYGTASSQFSCGNSKSIKNIRIINCKFNNFYRTALGLYNDNTARSAKTYTGNVVIENCTFTNISDVAVQSSNYSARIINSQFDGVGAECITVDNGCDDYIISGCYFSNYLANAGAIGTDESRNVTIVNNSFDGTGMAAEYGAAISVNANTGINYNLTISANNFTNNKYGVAIAPYFNESYAKCIENASICGNTFNGTVISDIVVYSYDSGSNLTISGNTYSSSADHKIDLRKTTNINTIKADRALPLTAAAGTGFTLDKNNSRYINGVLYIDAVVTQTDTSLTGWQKIVTFNLNASYTALYEELLNSSYEHVSFIDSQLNANGYSVYIPDGAANKFIIKKTINL